MENTRPEYKVDNTLDLMEELLSGVPSKSEKKVSKVSNPFEASNVASTKGKKKPATFGNENIGQPRSKSRISNSDLDDLLGIPSKPANALDDLLKIE